MCVNASLSQDGFYWTGVWVEHPLMSPPPLISSDPFCARVVKEVSWLREWEICGLGKVHSSLSVILLFSSWSFGPYRMNLQLLYHVLGKEETSTFLPQDNRMTESWLFPNGLSHRAGGQFGLPYLDSPAHHLSSRIAQICFLGKWAPRVTVSKHKCLSNLCLLQTWCFISQQQAPWPVQSLCGRIPHGGGSWDTWLFGDSNITMSHNSVRCS